MKSRLRSALSRKRFLNEMETQPIKIKNAVALGREIFRLESERRFVLDVIRVNKESLNRIESLLAQCWIKKAEMERGQ